MAWTEHDLPLYTLGGRPYVNGLTLLEEALAGTARATGQRPTAVLRFQAQRFVRAHARLAVAPKATADRQRVRRAAARLDLQLPNGPVVALVEPLDDAPVEVDRAEYDRAAYVPALTPAADGALTARLDRIGGMVDLLRAGIEAMHRVETARVRGEGNPGRVSWAWLKRLPWLPDAEAAEVRSIRYDPPRFLPGRGVQYVLRDLALADGPSATEVAMFAPLAGQPDPALGDPA